MDLGAPTGVPPNQTQFFCFDKHVHQKVSASEVSTPHPERGNSGSATAPQTLGWKGWGSQLPTLPPSSYNSKASTRVQMGL